MAERWTVVVHGGAKTIRPGLAQATRAGCAAAAAAAAAVVRGGGGAVDAVVAAIRVLEDDPAFNAGFGSVRTADGQVEMDAALMDGRTLDVGAVACVQRLRNPVRAAAALLRATPVLLCGAGAERFAQAAGLELCRPEALLGPPPAAAKNQGGHDTVGCIVRDRAGNVAAGTSTGGLPGKVPGRIGDSPIPGCGLFADNAVGAASLSGDGESIIRTLLAGRIAAALETMGAQKAADVLPAHLARVGGEAGAIVVDRRGALGIAHTSPNFAIGIQTDAMAAPATLLHAHEWQGPGHDH